MSNPIHTLYTQLVNDATFSPASSTEERERNAWSEAVRRYRQYVKNNMALSLAGIPTKKFQDSTPDTNLGKVPPRQGPPSSLEDSMKVGQTETLDYATPQPQNIENNRQPLTALERTKEDMEITKTSLDAIVDTLKSLTSGWGKKTRPAIGLKVPSMKAPTVKVGGLGTPSIQNSQLSNVYAVATAAAKKAGYDDFTAGSPGDKKREEIVLALKREYDIKKEEQPEKPQLRVTVATDAFGNRLTAKELKHLKRTGVSPYRWSLPKVEGEKEQLDYSNPQSKKQGIKKATRQETSLSQLRALTNLGPLKIKELHDDGDVTVRSEGKNFVVTTDGSKFKEIQKARKLFPNEPVVRYKHPASIVGKKYDTKKAAEKAIEATGARRTGPGTIPENEYGHFRVTRHPDTPYNPYSQKKAKFTVEHVTKVPQEENLPGKNIDFQQPLTERMRPTLYNINPKGMKNIQNLTKALQPHHLSSIVDATKKFGGSSTTIHGEDAAELAKQGKFGRYFVGAYPHHSVEMPEHEFNENRLGDFVHRHNELLSLPHHAIGTWKEGGKVYLDIARGVHDLKDAHALGHQHKQQAIYDAVGNEVINVQEPAIQKGLRWGDVVPNSVDYNPETGSKYAEHVQDDPHMTRDYQTPGGGYLDNLVQRTPGTYPIPERPSRKMPEHEVDTPVGIQNILKAKEKWHTHNGLQWHKHTYEGAVPSIIAHPKATRQHVVEHTHVPGTSRMMRHRDYTKLVGDQDAYDEHYRTMNRWDKEPIQPFEHITGGYDATRHLGLRPEAVRYERMPKHQVASGDVKALQNAEDKFKEAIPNTVARHPASILSNRFSRYLEYEGGRKTNPYAPSKYTKAHEKVSQKLPEHKIGPGDVKALQNSKDPDYYTRYTHPRTQKPDIKAEDLYDESKWGTFKATHAPRLLETSRSVFYSRSKAKKILPTLPQLTFETIRAPIQNSKDFLQYLVKAYRDKYSVYGADIGPKQTFPSLNHAVVFIKHHLRADGNAMLANESHYGQVNVYREGINRYRIHHGIHPEVSPYTRERRNKAAVEHLKRVNTVFRMYGAETEPDYTVDWN